MSGYARLRIAAATLSVALASCAATGTDTAANCRKPGLPADRVNGLQADHVKGSPASKMAGAQDAGRATSHKRFDDVEHWAKTFDDPTRAEWQKPADLTAALAIKPGMKVADLGAGTGFFLPYLSRAVGPTGTVIAMDVEPNLVAHMKARATKERLANVEVVLTPTDRLSISDHSLDLMLIVDTYHHIDYRLDYFRAAAGKLRRAGRIAIVEWKPGDYADGPAPDHKIARERVETEMTAAGYRLAASPDVLPYQYVLVFIWSGGTIPSR